MGYVFRADAIELNMGTMLVGVILSAILLGVCLTQTFYYYSNYPQDRWYHKSLVGSVAILDTLHMAAITHTMYHYLITHFNRPIELDYLIWSIVIEALFTGVTGALVQCFYLARIWRLSERNYLLTALVLFFILADAGCGTVWVILAMRIDTYDQLIKINPLTITINALSTAADCLIAAALCWFLWQARTGYKKSDNVINKVILFVVNTGVLTSMCAIAALIALVISPHTLTYASFYFCIGRFYTNAFLATLNARNRLTPSHPNSNTTAPHLGLSTTMPGTHTILHRPSSPITPGTCDLKLASTTDGGQVVDLEAQRRPTRPVSGVGVGVGLQVKIEKQLYVVEDGIESNSSIHPDPEKEEQAESEMSVQGEHEHDQDEQEVVRWPFFGFFRY